MVSKYSRKIAVIGLGYVGLPIAVAFGRKTTVVAFDINEKRITELKQDFDNTLEVTSDDLINSKMLLTANPSDLRKADFHIIAVPTPINEAKQPDLSCLLGASKIVGEQLKQEDIVVYESTVYPGATEEDCVPVLERFSGLKCGRDFFVGYSPERINPGDKKHGFTSIKKVVSAQNEEILDIVTAVYESVIVAGVYKAQSIKVAEAAKIIENTQRDLNIALINELSLIFGIMGIDTNDVLTAAATKWNFLPFKPGLVGGHCIGVDPYYLAYKANVLGLHPQVILSGRRVNDNMGKYIAEQTIKQMVKFNQPINGAKVAILGLTFKENCNDIRNTRVVDIVTELKNYHINVFVHDPLADAKQVQEEYGINLVNFETIADVDVIILAVVHDFYLQISLEDLIKKIKMPGLIIDVKGVLDREQVAKHKINIWRL